MPDTVRESPVTLEEYGAMDMAARREVWLEISQISKEELEAHMEEEKAREADVPQGHAIKTSRYGTQGRQELLLVTQSRLESHYTCGHHPHG